VVLPDNGFWIVYNDFVLRNGEAARFQFGLVGSARANGTLDLEPPTAFGDWNNTRWGSQEKNWAPFVADGRVYAHQWLAEPKTGASVAYEIDPSTGAILERHECAGAGTALRAALRVDAKTWVAGGTNVEALGQSHSLALGHTFSATLPYRVYAMFGYILQMRPPFCIVGATQPFHLVAPADMHDMAATTNPHPVPTVSVKRLGTQGNINIQFPTGLSLIRGGAYLLSWGRGDRTSHLSAFQPDWLLARMMHLHNGTGIPWHMRRAPIPQAAQGARSTTFLLHNPRVTATDVHVEGMTADRYFTVLRAGGAWWLLTRINRALYLRSSADGRAFARRFQILDDDASVNAGALILGTDALAAVCATDGANFGGVTGILVIGGKSGDGTKLEHRKDGVRGIRGYSLDLAGHHLTEAFGGAAILQGNSPGCVEGRGFLQGKHNFKGWCEFDGRFSVVFWRGTFWLYGRANIAWGARSVQVTRSPDLKAWDAWRLVTIEGSPTDTGRNIYFFAVAPNPAEADTLVALFPISHLPVYVSTQDSNYSISAALTPGFLVIQFNLN